MFNMILKSKRQYKMLKSHRLPDVNFRSATLFSVCSSAGEHYPYCLFYHYYKSKIESDVKLWSEEKLCLCMMVKQIQENEEKITFILMICFVFP